MGKPGMMHKQEAWAHTVDREGKPHPYPQRVSIDLDSKTGQGPWPVGSYLISPSSFYVGSFGDLQMGRLQLVPMTQPVRAAA